MVFFVFSYAFLLHSLRCVCVHMSIPLLMSGNDTKTSGSRHGTQVTRLGSKGLSPWSHLTSPPVLHVYSFCLCYESHSSSIPLHRARCLQQKGHSLHTFEVSLKSLWPVACREVFHTYYWDFCLAIHGFWGLSPIKSASIHTLAREMYFVING